MNRKLLRGKMIGVLAVLMLLIMAVGVAEEERTDAGGQWKYVLLDGEATIIGYVEEPVGDLVIPSDLDGYVVTGIGDKTFSECWDVTSVAIPASVAHIGDWAFSGCMYVNSITMPEGVTSIGSYAFVDCRGLPSVTIPESVTAIGGQVFDGCDTLTLIVTEGGYAEQYAKNNDIPYVLAAVAMTDDQAFIPIDGSSFTFSSGVGGWSTEVIVAEDGSFTGYFHDTDMGDTGDDYPEGTRYECFFTGVFVVARKIDLFTYELRLTALNVKEDAGVERIEDGVRVISAGAYGLENGDVFMLYCPGRATADLPENFLDWIRMPNAWEEIPDALPFYGLYNTAEEFGFFSYADR